MIYSKILKCAAVVLFVGALLASCSKPAVEVAEPVIKIDASSITLDSKAGSQSISFSIENPTEEKLVASSDSEWLGVSVKESAIVVTYEENPEEVAREAKITAYYPGAKQVEIVASQAAQPSPFTLEVLEVDVTSANIKITPSDPEMKYIAFVLDKETYNTFKSEDELFADDLAYIEEEASYASYWGMTEQEVKDEYASKGVFEGAFESLDPETDYVLYAYGVNEEITKKITKIVTTEFSTLPLPPKEMIAMSFDINVTVSGPTTATYKVTTDTEDQYFYAGIVESAKYAGKSDNEISEDIWAEVLEESGDYISAYWDYLWPVVEEEATYEDLTPSTEYMVIAFAVDQLYGPISDAKSVTFATPAGDASTESSVKLVKPLSSKISSLQKPSKSVNNRKGLRSTK